MLPIQSDKKYVTLNESCNKVVSVVFGSAGVVEYDETDPLLRIEDITAQVEAGYTFDADSEAYLAPTPVIHSIDISGNVELQSGISSQFTVTVKDDEVVDTGFAGTYYIPLMNILTGQLAQMLKVDMLSGVGTVSVQLSSSGMYAINFAKVTPKLSKSYSLTGVKELVVL